MLHTGPILPKREPSSADDLELQLAAVRRDLQRANEGLAAERKEAFAQGYAKAIDEAAAKADYFRVVDYRENKPDGSERLHYSNAQVSNAVRITARTISEDIRGLLTKEKEGA